MISKGSGRELPISLYDAGYQKIREDESCRWPFYQIVCCYHGTGALRIGDRLHPLSPGTIVFLPPGTDHAYYAGPEPYYVSWISFVGPLAQSLPAYYDKNEPLRPVVAQDDLHPNLHLQIMSVMEYVDMSDSAERISVLLYGIFTEFLLQMHSAAEIPERHASHAKIEAVVQWMRNHLQLPPDIGELARSFQISRQHLNRMFQARYGTTPKDFFVKLKILQAQKDLVHFPDTDIQEIAFRLGYASASHFARVFRNVTGVSPSKFRETDSSKHSPVESDSDKDFAVETYK